MEDIHPQEQRHKAGQDTPGGGDARRSAWASTATGNVSVHWVTAHLPEKRTSVSLFDREQRERTKSTSLSEGAAVATGAGRRRSPEKPDPFRTCFQRDRDRILHSDAFRRLAGKTQVFVFPRDHQRTRLTHALEVSQVASSIARALRLDVDLTEAIALGHDCGHGPGGHSSEAALQPYVDGGFDHAPWGAYEVLSPLNLCEETLDGIANHSWSRPAPATLEGEVVALSDRIAYCTHDFEDAWRAGIIEREDLPREVRTLVGTTRGSQLNALIEDVIWLAADRGVVGLSHPMGEALAAFRNFNYDHIYNRPESQRQGQAVIDLLQALTEHLLAKPELVPDLQLSADPARQVIRYVAGMTDRYAFQMAIDLLGWTTDRLPRGIDVS